MKMSLYFAEMERWLHDIQVTEQRIPTLAETKQALRPALLKFCKGRMNPTYLNGDIERAYWEEFG